MHDALSCASCNWLCERPYHKCNILVSSKCKKCIGDKYILKIIKNLMQTGNVLSANTKMKVDFQRSTAFVCNRPLRVKKLQRTMNQPNGGIQLPSFCHIAYLHPRMIKISNTNIRKKLSGGDPSNLIRQLYARNTH